MSESNAIAILIELAEKHSDRQARALGQALRQESSESTRLAMLENYRSSYLRSLAECQQRGLSPALLCNFHEFLARLDTAIGQQRVAVEDAQRTSETARTQLTDAEKKRKSLVHIADKRAVVRRRVEDRKEQKEQDEFATRARWREHEIT